MKETNNGVKLKVEKLNIEELLEEMESVRINVTMSRGLREKTKEKAKELDLSMSGYIRMLLQMQLKE